MTSVTQRRHPPYPGCPDSPESVSGHVGMGVRIESEQVSGFDRNTHKNATTPLRADNPFANSK